MDKAFAATLAPLPILRKSAARAALVGTAKRADGTLQVTYHGHPLYGFSKDTKRGQITCQNVANFGGKWWVITAAGKVVR